jgi:hypothetical protein
MVLDYVLMNRGARNHFVVKNYFEFLYANLLPQKLL